MKAKSLDIVTLEVVRNYLVALTEEMRLILMGSARSSVLKEAGDLSTALTDPRGCIVAQARCLPIHLGVMASTVKELLARVRSSELSPGDVIFTNDLEVGGNHLPDVKAITPIFGRRGIIAYAINLAHWPDIGGATPGSYVTDAREIYQEGLQITPVRLFSARGPENALIDLLVSNVRRSDDARGDIFAQRAANEVARRRLVELCDKYGEDVISAAFAQIQDESYKRMSVRIRALTPGTYTGSDALDPIADQRITIVVKLTVADGHIHADFEGTTAQVPLPLNTTRFATCSATYFALKALFDPYSPVSDGTYRCVKIEAPAQSVLNADRRAAVAGGNIETSSKVVGAIFRALAPVVRDRVSAGAFGSSATIVWGFGAVKDDTLIHRESHGGGGGAGLGWDGPNGIRNLLGNTMNTPVEVVEATVPLQVEAYELVDGSGGTGRHRGGLGLRRRYRLLSGRAQVSVMTDACVEGPWGLFGGQAGRPCRVMLTANDQATQLPARTTVWLSAGDALQIETAGGGGYGAAHERDSAACSHDVVNGYVNTAASADDNTEGR